MGNDWEGDGSPGPEYVLTDTGSHFSWVLKAQPPLAVHDYVPGRRTHKMQTDPQCRECGAAKNAPVHG